MFGYISKAEAEYRRSTLKRELEISEARRAGLEAELQAERANRPKRRMVLVGSSSPRPDNEIDADGWRVEERCLIVTRKGVPVAQFAEWSDVRFIEVSA